MDANGPGNKNYKAANSIYDFHAISNENKLVTLDNYRNHVCIIVNVASYCETANVNYTQLVDLFERYGNTKGLRILAFPCNQFMAQEPGTNEDIKRVVERYCEAGNGKISLFTKVNVNGENAHPLWKYLKEKQRGTVDDSIKWNFTKFIIDKRGKPVARYSPMINPYEMEKDLLEYLNAPI